MNIQIFDIFLAASFEDAIYSNLAVTDSLHTSSKRIQKEEKNRDWAEKQHDLLAVLVHDTKPVHLLSTTASEVRWVVKNRAVWSTAVQKKAMMKSLHLNVIEEYNKYMNSTDIADH